MNYLSVALGLLDEGKVPKGVRLDSGALDKLAEECRNIIQQVSQHLHRPDLLH